MELESIFCLKFLILRSSYTIKLSSFFLICTFLQAILFKFATDSNTISIYVLIPFFGRFRSYKTGIRVPICYYIGWVSLFIVLLSY